jgi:hypothetical protein
VSAVYNCCWASPAQLFSGPCPAGIMTPTWRAISPYLYPPGTWWPGYTSRQCVPFSSPPTTRKDTVDVFESTSTRDSVFCRAEQSRSLLPAISRHGHSWHRAPVGPVAIYLLDVETFVFFFFLWGALSDERTDLTFIYAAGPCQRNLSFCLLFSADFWL